LQLHKNLLSQLCMPKAK